MYVMESSISSLIIAFLSFFFLGRMLRTRILGGCISIVIGVFVLVFVLVFVMNPEFINIFNFGRIDEILFRENPLLIVAVFGGFFVGLRITT